MDASDGYPTPDPLRALVIGATGQLGTAFCAALGAYAVPIGRGRLDLSVLDPDTAIRAIRESEADVVINCAAYTAVDAAESEEALAIAINASAVEVLAMATGDLGVRLVTFSTDYVFDGTKREPYVETDPTGPLNAYGRSKLLGETLALAANPEVLIIRTSWLVSATHPNFVATMLRRAGAGEALRVVADSLGTPTIVGDLVAASGAAIERRATGLLHLANSAVASWYDVAREALSVAGLGSVTVTPISSSDYPTAAARPEYSALGSERLAQLGLEPMPDWRSAMGPVVAALVARGR